MERQGDMSFRTTRPISKGDKFKVLVANSIECYVYVFGQETDGSSYVLFPIPKNILHIVVSQEPDYFPEIIQW
jgi:hypothetical protein